MPEARFNSVQEVPVSVRFLDDHGRVVAVDGAPVWEAGDANLVDLDVAADGLSCIVRSRDRAGRTTLTVRADAQIGADVREIQGVLDLEVTESGAVTVEFNVGEPRDRTA